MKYWQTLMAMISNLQIRLNAKQMELKLIQDRCTHVSSKVVEDDKELCEECGKIIGKAK